MVYRKGLFLKYVSINNFISCLLLGILLASCNNSDQIVELTNHDLNSKYQVSYYSNNKQFDVWGKGQDIKIGNHTLKDISCNIEEAKYLEIVEDFQLLEYVSNPIQIIFYIDNTSYEKYNLSKENVIGISIYDLRDNKLYHRFIKSIPMGFKNIEFYDCEVGAINHNLTDFLLEVEMNNYLSKNTNIISFSKNNLQQFVLKQPKDESFLRIALKQKMLMKLKRNNNYQDQFMGIAPGNGNPQGCGTRDGCENGTSDEVCRSAAFSAPAYCYAKDNAPGKCQDAENFDIVIDYGDTTLAMNAHNFNLHYNFRDNFLTQTIFGKAYDTYFYALDQYVDGKISIQLALETANVLIGFNQLIIKLLNPTQYSNDTLFTTTQKNNLITLLNQYKVLNPDTYYQMMIDDAINDVNLYSQYTISQFCSAIYFTY